MSSDFDIKDSIMKIHPYTPGESEIVTDFPLRQLAANEAPLGPPTPLCMCMCERGECGFAWIATQTDGADGRQTDV